MHESMKSEKREITLQAVFHPITVMDTDIEYAGNKACDVGEKDCSDLSKSQGMPKIFDNYQKPKESHATDFLRFQKEQTLLISSF